MGAGEEPMSSSVLATLQRENPPEQDFPRVQTSAQHSERTRLTTETSGKKKTNPIPDPLLLLDASEIRKTG